MTEELEGALAFAAFFFFFHEQLASGQWQIAKFMITFLEICRGLEENFSLLTRMSGLILSD